jgi:uncharacterized membrane protein
MASHLTGSCFEEDGESARTIKSKEMKPGIIVYGLATIATGAIDLTWGAFAAGYEPIQAFGDTIPGRTVLAYAAGTCLVIAGAAILWSRTARAGALVLGILYGIFAIFWLPRLCTAPHILGYYPAVYIGVLDGVGQQIVLLAAALIVYAVYSPQNAQLQSRTTSVARWLVGLSSVEFGLAHLTGIPAVAPLVPKWLPPGQSFWVVLTGIAFVLAGIGILTRVLDVLAARLLALMLLVFSALVLAPNLAAFPHAKDAWDANAFNLAAVAAVWIFAQWLATRREGHLC